MNKEKRYYYYEVRMSEDLMKQIKYLACQWDEELDLCIQRTLKSGLIARKETKMKLRERLCKEPEFHNEVNLPR